jgi:hypothetical protein
MHCPRTIAELSCLHVYLCYVCIVMFGNTLDMVCLHVNDCLYNGHKKALMVGHLPIKLLYTLYNFPKSNSNRRTIAYHSQGGYVTFTVTLNDN